MTPSAPPLWKNCMMPLQIIYIVIHRDSQTLFMRSVFSKGFLHDWKSCKNTEKITVTTHLPVFETNFYIKESSVLNKTAFRSYKNKDVDKSDVTSLKLNNNYDDILYLPVSFYFS